MRVLITSILFCFLLAACGKGEEGSMGSSKSSGKAASGEMGGMGDSGSGAFANGKTVDGTFYPNHDKDAKEFEVKSSLAGVERMIEHYKEEGYDTSELEKKKADLENKLADLTG